MQTGSHIKDIYTLSPMQEGILFHALMEENANTFTYFEQMSFHLVGDLDIHLFKKSLNMLFERHDILRTIFVYENIKRPVQVVLKKREVAFLYEDKREITSKEEKEQFIREFKEKDKERSFDLTRDILLRVAVLQTEKREYVVVWSFHHILMDGWSTGILISEFFEIYDSLLENRALRLADAIPYRVYIQWLEEQDKDKSKNYWKNYLEGYGEKAVIPGLKAFKASESRYKLEQVPISLDKEKIEPLAARNQVSLNTVMQTVWGVLLAKYNCQTDVVFGAVVSGRPPHLEGSEAMVGLFINTIPVRVCYEKTTTFSQLLQEIQQKAVDSEPYHYYPLADIQSQSLLKQDLIDHILVFENYPIAERIEGIMEESDTVNRRPEFGVANVDVFEQSNYNFGVRIMPGKRLKIEFDFNSHVYDRKCIERIANHFNQMMDQILDDDEEWIDIDGLTLLSEAERKQILEDFNRTRREFPMNKTLHQLFEEQVERTPDNIAVIAQHAEGYAMYKMRCAVSYRELNRKANQLAHLLRSKGVEPETTAAIMTDRSPGMIVGILAILKAGGAYLPIDTDCPWQRVHTMLADSGTHILLTTKELWSQIDFQREMIDLEDEMVYQGDVSNPGKINTSTDLAYVIYTSGSTGTPKGVLIKHENILNYIFWRINEFKYTPTDVTLQLVSISFDGFCANLYPTILSGGKVVHLDRDRWRDSDSIRKVMNEEGITNFSVVPSLYRGLVEGAEKKDDGTLRFVVLAGEKADAKLIHLSKTIMPGIELVNEYGPTENTVTTIFNRGMTSINTAVIGTPIANNHVLILDEKQVLNPLIFPGELCVSGVSLSRGYLNNPELTRQHFVQNPYIPEETMYRTGDLARWLLDGKIEFLGRIDQQVKIRGFRVEPGEIENQLLNHKKIEEAVVISKENEDGDKYLCAYIVSEDGVPLSAAELREYMLEYVPGYMVPSYFILLDQIPRTANGKIERNALPDPEIKAGDGFIAPRNEMEEKMAEIWSEALGIEKNVIGIDSDFFKLGGHSLKATLMVVKVHKEFNVKFPMKEVYDTPTIRALSRRIKNAAKDKFSAIGAAEEKEYYNLSSVQKRMYIAQQMEIESTSYNMPDIMVLKGTLDHERLEETFKQLIKRHESLRTSFILLEGGLVQKIHKEVAFKIGFYDLTRTQVDHSPQDIIKRFVKPFDLSRAPLLRVGLIETGDAEYLLMVDMHHIINDAASREILIKDFIALYKINGNENDLPPLKIQYKDFSEWQNRLFQSGEIDKQEEYWLNKFKGDIPFLNMPTDYQRPSKRRIDEGDHIEFLLDNQLNVKVFDIMEKTDTTLYMFLLAVYNVFLFKYTKDEDIVVGTPIAGRRHADLQNVIGVFLNMLAMRNKPRGDKRFFDFLQEVKNNALEAYENQDYQFEELVTALGLQGDAARNPLFDTEFSVIKMEPHTQPTQEARIPGLAVKPYADEHRFAKFDLHFQAAEVGRTIQMFVRYSTELFKKSTIKKIKEYYIEILQQVVGNMKIKLRDITVSHRRLAVKPNVPQDDSSDFLL
jgi:bacitracin synthase 3